MNLVLFRARRFAHDCSRYMDALFSIYLWRPGILITETISNKKYYRISYLLY